MKIDANWIGLGILVLVGGVVLWANPGILSPSSSGGGDDSIRVMTTPDRAPSCKGLAGEPIDRLNDCFGQLSAKVKLSRGATDELAKLAKSGPVFSVGAPLDTTTPHTVLNDDAPIIDVLMRRDEKAANQALRDKGARVVVVHRDLTGALDRTNKVLSRLAQHDHLEWFQLRYVTEELMIYTVRTSATRMPDSTGDSLIKGLRARLEGKKPAKQTWNPSAVRIIASVRLQGATLASRHSVGTNLERVLDELAAKLKKRWNREVLVQGHGYLRDRLPDARLEVHVVMERARIEPRSRFQIFDLWEMGIDGMMFSHREGVKNQKFTYMPGSELVTHSHRSADQFLQYAVQKGDWRDKRPWEDPTTRLDLIRDQHFIEDRPGGGGKTVRLVRGFPETTMDDITDDGIRQMLIDGGEWWLRNFRPDNSFNYKYWPTQGRMSTDYNEVRHILGTRDLADVYRYRKDERYLVGAKRAMDWLMQYAVHDTDVKHRSLLHPPDGTMLFRVDNNQKLGTVAVALLGWIEWARQSGDHSQDENIRKMAKFTMFRNLENGKFDPYYVPKGHSYYGSVNDIVPGEAALALGEVAEYFGETSPWLDFWPKYIDFYEPWFRKRAAKKKAHGRWPTDHYNNADRLEIVQFGPWSVMAARQYYELTGDERAADFGLEVADWIIDNYQWSSDRTPFPDYTGGYYKLPNETPAMQTFCYAEGTAAAYRLAAQHAPERKDKYDRSTREAIRFLKVMQYDDVNAYFVPDPELVHGGIKYTMNENKIRIDYEGHGLSTLSQYLDAMEIDPARERELSPIDLDGPPNPGRINQPAQWRNHDLDDGRAPDDKVGNVETSDEGAGEDEGAE